MNRASRRTSAVIASLAATVPLLIGCGSAHASFQWRKVSIAGRTRCLPVAFTLADQERGLMGVKRVVRPMVFAYSPPDTPSFWMKDTPAPLTGVWVGSSNRVIGYWYGRPESTDLHPAPAPVSAVIEYPAGAKVPARGARFAIGVRCVTADRHL
jgi:uncharacterized membrane protein (UPF0127 family)